jgi:putative oxidoreductase
LGCLPNPFYPIKEYTMKNISIAIGRIMLGHIFLLAGISKISAYAGTQAYMASMGVPGMLLPLVIATEILGGLAVILGWQTRWASLALAGFTLLAGMIFHTDFSNQMQSIMFMKNIAIAGGLIILAAQGAGTMSVDGRLGKA